MKIPITATLAVSLLATGLSAFSFRGSVPTPAPHRAHIAAVRGERPPVLVELFTSEGCSDCPPADRVLMDLARRQPVAGARVVALGEHVDYWDNSRWRDPFSSAAFSRRQNDYASAFRLDQVYTPEMVVDGQREFVGSDAGAALQAIESAAERPHARVSVEISGESVHVQAAGLPAQSGDPHLFVSFTEDGLTSRVRGGENAGATLRHWAVARYLTDLGPVSTSTSQSLTIPAPRRGKPINIVAFIQDTHSRRILGSTQVTEGV